MKEVQLSSLASDALASFKRPTDYTPFDMLLVAAFNYDLMEVIRNSCLFEDNWWFVAHFVDLLSAGNQLASHSIEDEKRLREFLLMDYADSLVSHSSLWSVSVEYFDSCSRIGRQRLESALERIPLESEKKAEAVLNIVTKRKLKNLYRTICRSMAQKWLSQGNCSSALVWGVKGDDAHVCSFVAEAMLKEYVKTGSFVDTDVLSSLGTRMLVSDRLTFLTKYYEYHQIKKLEPPEEAKGIAADLLVSLISSNISPGFFLPVLLLDAKNLLQEQNVSIFNATQSSQVLAALEDALSNDKILSDDFSGYPAVNQKFSQLREQEGVLRFLLQKVLAVNSLFSS